MFSSVLGALKQITVGGGVNEDKYSKDNPGVATPQVTTWVLNSQETTHPLEIQPEENEYGLEEKVTGIGVITSLDIENGNGVIDRMYKFKLPNKSPPDERYERGKILNFHAVRSQKHPQWLVTSLSFPVDQWENPQDDEEPSSQKTVTCFVARVDKRFIEVVPDAEDETNSDQRKLFKLPNRPELNIGFKWIAGDWMQLTLKSFGTEVEGDENKKVKRISMDEIVSARPAQRKTVVGRLSKRNDSFVVDDSILCTGDVFKHMYAIGAMVKCEAISSNQFIGNDKDDQVTWRAIAIQKSNFLNYTGSIDPEMSDLDWQVDQIGRDAIHRHQELTQDKMGIRIFPRFLHFPPLLVGTTAVKSFTVQNHSKNTYTLLKFQAQEDASVCQFKVKSSREQANGSVTFMPDEQIIFELSCTPQMIGRTTEIVIFNFGNFKIARNFGVIGRIPEEETLVVDVAYGQPNYRKRMGQQDVLKMIANRDRTLIKGNKLIRAPFFCKNRLPVNKIPTELFEILKQQNESNLLKLYPKCLEVLTFENYQQKFQVALWFEEIENEIRRRLHDIEDVILERCPTKEGYYKFYAPTIEEVQPPVNVQDSIDVFSPGCVSSAKFQGTVVKIVDSEVTCVFGKAFDNQYNGCPLTVQFNLSRSNYRRCHYAVQTAIDYLGNVFLFPDEDIVVHPPRILVKEDNESGTVDQEVEGVDQSVASPIDSSPEPEVPVSNLDTMEKEGNSPPLEVKEKTSSIFRKHHRSVMFSNGHDDKPDSTENVGGKGKRVASFHKFVSDTPSGPSSCTAQLKWFNTSLNTEQKDAVRRILRGQARPLPYIIFGPPGTGKTVTLVEAIMQVNKLDENSRVLVCAPSNTAADMIANLLVNSGQYSPGDFVRLNGFLRASQPLLEPIAMFCTDGEELDKVAKNRLIVTTCMTAGQFMFLNLPDGHFTHVFVDEAGCCTEPETLIPAILLTLSKGGQMVLAGDPNQLGPVLMSDESQNVGLSRSFIERLMRRTVYSRNQHKFPKEKYNPLVLTKLVKNYRAHPTLLKLPSRLFYDDDLESMASLKEVQALCQDKIMKGILVNEGVPLIFHGVQGDCVREKDSPSWCNKAEAIQVAYYVRILMKKVGLSADDIGIITPYRKQVEKITLALILNIAKKDKKFQLPKVASVEEFQGGERKVIIISTVRSANETKTGPQTERLAFLYQPRRFNVVITRAKALLIVIGNPFVLCRDHHWFQLLRYCLDLNAYKGCNLPIHLDRNMRNLARDKERKPAISDIASGDQSNGAVNQNDEEYNDESSVRRSDEAIEF